ncbi:MAG TPA: hypothetical protein VIH29_08865 [Gallionella sp.]
MKRSALAVILLILALTACEKKPAETSAGVSAGSKVDISAPVDGARLDAKAQIKLDYDITLGGEGDHAHVYVDDRRIAMLRQMKGSYMIFPLDPGVREICIKVVNSNHTPTGVARCVKVTAG